MSAQWPVGSRCNTPCATKNFCAVHWAKMHIPFRLKIIMGVNQVIKALFFTCFQRERERERDEGSFYVDIVEVTTICYRLWKTFKDIFILASTTILSNLKDEKSKSSMKT